MTTKDVKCAAAIERAIRKERAACAKIADANTAPWEGGPYGLYFDGQDATATKIAKEIRARSRRKRAKKEVQP